MYNSITMQLKHDDAVDLYMRTFLYPDLLKS